MDNTKVAVEEAVATIIKRFEDSLAEREALINSTDPELLEAYKSKAGEMKLFFDNMPWNTD